MARAAIAGLFVYPVKGCRGVAVNAATATVRGLVAGTLADREWMIVDANGRFVTQREHPRLAMVVVWRSTASAIDAGDEPARWLSAYLGAAARLVRFAPEHVRACNPEFVGTSGAHTMFADGYPLLVISQASLDELNRRLAAHGERALPMNRFRPGVVVAGLEPHDEDHVDTIAIAGLTLRMVKPCVRCRVTTTDQDDASVGDEPLATLAAYRMSERFGGVTFGMNAIVAGGAGGTLAIGDEASVDYRF